MTVKEVAVKLGVTPAAVYKRLRKMNIPVNSENTGKYGDLPEEVVKRLLETSGKGKLVENPVELEKRLKDWENREASAIERAEKAEAELAEERKKNEELNRRLLDLAEKLAVQTETATRLADQAQQLHLLQLQADTQKRRGFFARLLGRGKE